MTATIKAYPIYAETPIPTIHVRATECDGFVRVALQFDAVGRLNEARDVYFKPADARELARILNVQASIAEGFKK